MFKILFVIDRLDVVGGAQKSMHNLVTYFERNNFAVKIHTPKGAYSKYAIPQNVDFFGSINLCKKVRFLRGIIECVYLYVLERKIKPDIVVSFLGYSNLYNGLLANISNTKRVSSYRGDPFHVQCVINRIENNIIARTNKIVFQTVQASKLLKNEKKAVIIPNPILLSNLKWEQNCLTNDVIFVGRLENETKRLDVLIESFALVKCRVPEARLFICGEGPDAGLLTAMINKFNLNCNVFMLGKVDNVLELLVKANVFVLTSDHEGIPNALLEAISVNMPIVVTDYSPGGVKQYIASMHNGIVVAKGDVEAIARSLTYLLIEKGKASELAQELDVANKEFAYERIMNKWRGLICDLVGS